MRLSLIIMLFSITLIASPFSISGTVVSDNQSTIGTHNVGYIKTIHCEIGDRVRKGQTLFVLESAQFDMLKNQADLVLQQTQIIVDIYRTRLASIHREKALLRSHKNQLKLDWEHIDISAKNAKMGLEAARALLANATTKVKQFATINNSLKIKAPNNGIIVQKHIRVGDLLMPGMLAMLLVDLDNLEIQAQITEADLAKINEGDRVSVNIPSIAFQTDGYIKSIIPSANPMTHTFTLRVKFNKTHNKIYPGMYAKIELKK